MAEENGQNWSPDIAELGDRIVALTVAKAVQLGDYLEKKHGIKPAAAGVAVMPGPGGPGGPAPTEKPPEKTEFTVQLDGFDAAKKINVIKIVREITGLGLKEAKDLVDGAPKPVKEKVTKAEADDMKKKLEEQGASVQVK
jgi:large subunit ribosomal protein L7/L12